MEWFKFLSSQIHIIQTMQQLADWTTWISEDDESEGGQGYQLLTEVKNGAPLSSLFTILSLFTEDVTVATRRR